MLRVGRAITQRRKTSGLWAAPACMATVTKTCLWGGEIWIYNSGAKSRRGAELASSVRKVCLIWAASRLPVCPNLADTPLLRAARLGPRARPARPLRRSRAFLLDRDVMDDPQPEGLGRATRVRRVPAVRALRGRKWAEPSALFVARRGCLQRLVDHRPKWRGYTERQSTTRTPIPRHGTLGAQITQPCGTDSLPRARRRRLLRAGGGGPRQQASLAVHALEVPSGARCRQARTRARGDRPRSRCQIRVAPQRPSECTWRATKCH